MSQRRNIGAKMVQTLHIDGPTAVSVTIKRNRTAKRLSLRVSQVDGRTTLTAPSWVSEREIRAFVQDKSQWIRNAQPTSIDRPTIEDGAEILVEGEAVRIHLTGGARGAAQIVDGVFSIPGARAQSGKRAVAYLKLLARDRLVPHSQKFASQINREVGKVTLRDTRSRWGSCTADGNLMYSWRLIMAPPDVLEYVAAHEVAHLVEMNHSARFWNLVEQLMPDFENPRRWLKQHGRQLQAWDFGD